MEFVNVSNHSKYSMLSQYPDLRPEDIKVFYSPHTSIIYPSLNEGFGYPPLEAMRYGVPVIASAIASIPEILDNAALYFAPFSVEEFQNRIMQMTENQVHSDYSKRSIERFKIIKKTR